MIYMYDTYVLTICVQRYYIHILYIYDIHIWYRCMICTPSLCTKGDETLQSLGVFLQARVKAVKAPQSAVEDFSSFLYGIDDDDQGKY